jgi:hypothetical protein
VRKVNVRAARKALAVCYGVVRFVKGRLLNDGESLLDAGRLFGSADWDLGWVARHVEGSAAAVLEENKGRIISCKTQCPE